MPNNAPRAIRTVAVKGDQNDNAAPQAAAAPPAAAKPAAPPKPVAAPRNPPTSANASVNQPMSLAPQAAPAEPPQRMAATNPTQVAPAPDTSGGSYLVSITSQDSESAARESFRIQQGKYSSVLGSRSPVIKRVEMDGGKVKYRAMVGPYRTRAEAQQFCSELKAAGGQCFTP